LDVYVVYPDARPQRVNEAGRIVELLGRVLDLAEGRF
jgi:hypothetical protein